MLKKIRLIIAALVFVSITLLFLDFTGTLHAWLGWLAKIQLVPAILALNVGVVIILVLLTVLLGRVYCSVICPMGIFQDIIAWFGKRGKKLPYTYSRPKTWLRYGFLALFVIALLAGVTVIYTLLEPYSAYGRIANNLFQPLWQWGNNLLAYFAERADSYAFYTTDVWIKSVPVFIMAVITFIVVGILAWRNGRTYCNTICPVGTILGFISKYSLVKIRIDETKCNKCSVCARNCKASCIDYKNFKVDADRCVSCMNCIEKCPKDAIEYRFGKGTTGVASEPSSPNENGRRGFLSAVAILFVSTVKSQIIPKATDIKMDGGLADILPKEQPKRLTPLTPAGSESARHFKQHCTACQLCISACKEGVLRPSSSLESFMQPTMSFERGYCRPECVKCSEVCPASAIKKISKEEKSSIQIGHAVWIRERCISLKDEQQCDNCSRHCPTSAITMVLSNPSDEKSLKIPTINEERCIGCGACENLCPSRPLSAIYVEGHTTHKMI